MLTHARDIMKWCEEQSEVDYVLAMATNSQLQRRASDVIAKARADYEQRCQPVTALMERMFDPSEELDEAGKLVPSATWYRSLCYKTQDSWSCSRRVVTKVSYGSSGNQVRYVVTSLPADKYPPSLVYTKQYCPVMLRWRIVSKNNNWSCTARPHFYPNI